MAAISGRCYDTMAVLDPDDGYIVMRIVYDGAPLAGKTTSVASLARELGREISSPAEFEGRTLFFDWLDYRGGLLEGHKIRCQVISVPGQLTLGARRRRLLKTADAVVFVGESTAGGLAEDRLYLNELSALMRTRNMPPVGVVFQANKRDLPDALPLAAIHEFHDTSDLRMGVVETIATRNEGVHDAFVFAVRLALDRVRELLNAGKLRRMRPTIDSSDALLHDLLRLESEQPGASTPDRASPEEDQAEPHEADPLRRTMAAHVLRAVLRGEQLGQPTATSTRRVHPAARPAVPDANVGVGLIWPPIDGRLILQRLQGATITIDKQPDGCWAGEADAQWLLHSPQWFASLEAGRAALLAWARINASCATLLSRDRCIALTHDGAGGYRLWQVVRRMPTVATLLEELVTTRGVAAATSVKALLTNMLQWADHVARTGHALPVSLTTLGGTTNQLMYVGFVPLPEAAPKTPLTRDELLVAWQAEVNDNPTLQAMLLDVATELQLGELPVLATH